MQPSSSICCSRRWCRRSPEDDKADTWMEPCRSSTTTTTKKSRRRQLTENNVEEEVNDGNNDDDVLVDDASQALLGEEENVDGELFHSGSSFEAAIKAADATSSSSIEKRACSSFSDATTPINNCSASTTQSGGGSSKWKFPSFSSGGRRPIIDAMDMLGKETVKGLRGAKFPSPPRGVLDDLRNNKCDATCSNQEGSSRRRLLPPTVTPSPKPITSIAILENGLFVTASKLEKYIKLWRVLEEKSEEYCDVAHNTDGRNKIEFICDFKGHVSGIITMVKLDKRGRFLSASVDKTVKLWEVNCNKDEYVKDGPNLLATFTNLDKRWIKSIVPIDEGSFVRPTDDVNISMVKAMAKKTVFEGPISMQQAAFERSIIQCSGVFATSSKNGKTIKVWEMSVVDNKTNDDSTTNNDVAKVCLVQELQHDAVIEAVDAAEDGCSIIVGDVMGDVFFWSKSKSYLSAFGVTKNKRWTLIHKFTWRDDIRVHTGEIFQRSITSLCFLDGTKKFVSGTKEGMVQIWNGNTSGKSQTVRVAEQPVSFIQKLSMNDPNVEGFSVCCDGGRVVALTVKFEGEDVIELDAFPVKTCNKEDGESSVITTMKAIAAPCNVSRTASLIVGDDNGTIHLSHIELN